MASSCQALVVTGAAVAFYCLAVSFGPDLLLGRAPNADDRPAVAEAQFSESSRGSGVILRKVQASSTCSGCVWVMSE
jgi:hypothetical protein